MKLCGCKEKCFEKGDMWGHLSGIMCSNLSEIVTNGSYCIKFHCEVNAYFNKQEYQKLTLKQRKEKLNSINNNIINNESSV